MGKFDWIPQPPQAERFTFLVDVIEGQGTFGITSDFDKIEFNRTTLGVEFNLDLGIDMALCEDCVSRLFSLGRFIVLFQISRDEQSGIMLFFDYQIRLSINQLRELLSLRFPTNLVDAWLEIQSGLKSASSPPDDIVQLVRL